MKNTNEMHSNDFFLATAAYAGINCMRLYDPDLEPTTIAPGATTEIKVEVTPDTPESFRKIVSVYGNVENAPLQLLVMGKIID